MRVTIGEFVDMVMRGETSEQYEKRIKRIRRLSNEKYDLLDGIQVLEESGNCEKDYTNLQKKRTRLAKVEKMLGELV